MRLDTFNFNDGVLFADNAVRLSDGSCLAGTWSYPWENWSYGGLEWSWPNTGKSYPAGSGWSYGFGGWSYPAAGTTKEQMSWPFTSYQWGVWSYMSYPTLDGWSYQGTGWSYAKGGWSYDHVDNWSWQSYVTYSYPAGWSVSSGWSYPRTFAIEAEHVNAGQVVLTSYLSAWWLNLVERGVDGTRVVTHPQGARVAPVSYGTLHTHPKAHGFMAFRLNSELSPWVGQVAKGYTPNRRHVISVYAWIDDIDQGSGEIYIDADWAPDTDTLTEQDDYINPQFNQTWTGASSTVFKRQAPNGNIDDSHTVPAGNGIYRFWTVVPHTAGGKSLRYRIRTDSNTFLWIDRIKHEPEKAKDIGIVTDTDSRWLECSAKQWSANQWVGMAAVITGGVAGVPFARTIESNTYNRLYITSPWATGSGLNTSTTFEIMGTADNARPTAYVDDGMAAQWIQSIRAEDIRGGVMTLGGSTVSGAVGGARLRVLNESDKELIVIGENTSGDGYRGMDLKGGSGARIAAGSGGKFEIGDNIDITEDGFFGYNNDGDQTIALRTTGEFHLLSSNAWKQRLEFDAIDGFRFFDEANVPFVSFNPKTGTVYLGREADANITILPTGTTVHGSLIVNETITADKMNVTDLQALGATIGGFTIGENTIEALTAAAGLLIDSSVPKIVLSDGTNDRVFIGKDGLEYYLKVLDAAGATLFSSEDSAPTLAGWTLEDGHLYSGTGASRVGLITTDANVRIYAGGDVPGSAPARIGKSGYVYFVSGTIGGFTLASDTIYSGGLKLDAASERIYFDADTYLYLQAANAIGCNENFYAANLLLGTSRQAGDPATDGYFVITLNGTAYRVPCLAD